MSWVECTDTFPSEFVISLSLLGVRHYLGVLFLWSNATALVWVQVILPLAAFYEQDNREGREEKDLFQMRYQLLSLPLVGTYSLFLYPLNLVSFRCF